MLYYSFFLLIPLSYELFFDHYTAEEYFYHLRKIEINENDSIKLIDKLTKILERYVYLDILKNPSQPKNKEHYFNEVNLIEELNLIKKGKRPFYDFYRDIRKVMDKCQDLHLLLDINENFAGYYFLKNSLLISPVILKIENKNIYSIPNNVYINHFYENIDLFENKPIKYINNLSPIEYIQKYNNNFLQFKSPQAQFISNLHYINNPFSLISLPLEIENLTNIVIIYDDNTARRYDYKIAFISNLALKINHYFWKLDNFFYECFNFFDMEWDTTIEDGNLKCYVDNENKVNVIYQNTFYSSNYEDGFIFFDECFSNFDNNIYPIIIIESFNGGGYGNLADYLISYINLNKTTSIYESYRYNEQVEKFVAIPIYKSIDTCEIKNSTDLFNLSHIEDNYGFNSKGEEIIHKRTKIFDLSTVNENFFYSKRKRAKYIRKPNEIIIFTDGYSYSATSVFIKQTQLKGGAIIVGYDGNPYLDSFDASLAPSPVFSTDSEYLNKKDNLSLEIEALGFSLSYTIAETFSELDNENKINIPLEYQIYEIDERVNIYNGYSDSKYQDFINEAKKIFKKYETQCNPKNKNLLLIDDKCYFLGPHLHGGFPCGDNGLWNKNKCVPSYCDVGYIYNKTENKCVKDYCFKKDEFNAYYYEHYKKVEIKNMSKITNIFIIIFVLFQIILIILMFTKRFKKIKNRKLLIMIIVFLEIILNGVLYILYNLEIKDII